MCKKIVSKGLSKYYLEVLYLKVVWDKTYKGEKCVWKMVKQVLIQQNILQ